MHSTTLRARKCGNEVLRHDEDDVYDWTRTDPKKILDRPRGNLESTPDRSLIDLGPIDLGPIDHDQLWAGVDQRWADVGRSWTKRGHSAGSAPTQHRPGSTKSTALGPSWSESEKPSRVMVDSSVENPRQVSRDAGQGWVELGRRQAMSTDSGGSETPRWESDTPGFRAPRVVDPRDA